MTSAASGWFAVGDTALLTDDRPFAVTVGRQALLLIRHAGQVYAIADRCSHADQELACGKVRDGWISCPAHGARFDLASGEPLNPPAREAITVFPVRVNAGTVEVQVAPEQ